MRILIEVNLVPSGPASSGWGAGKTQPNESSQRNSRAQQQPTQSTSQTADRPPAASAAASQPSVVAASSQQTSTQASASVSAAKTWSSVTSRTSLESERPAPSSATFSGKESMRFSRDFPTLDGTAGTGGKSGMSTQLELRPQSTSQQFTLICISLCVCVG